MTVHHIHRIAKNNKIFMVAYDQGLEHGPSKDFNHKNVDPQYVIDSAIKADASCIAMHYGLAKTHYKLPHTENLPLVVKLNGKPSLYSQTKRPALVASVDDALSLGAMGVGFTIYPGQEGETETYEQLAHVRRESERAGLALVVWSYARGPEIGNQYDKDVVAYATRTAAELGADVVKVKYSGSASNFSWAVKAAAGTRVIASGTDNFDWENYLQEIKAMLDSGASGVAIGRRFWQDPNPAEFGKNLGNIIYNS